MRPATKLSGKQFYLFWGVFFFCIFLAQACQQRSSIKHISYYLIALLFWPLFKTRRKKMYTKNKYKQFTTSLQKFHSNYQRERDFMKFGKEFWLFLSRIFIHFLVWLYISYHNRGRHCNVTVQLHYRITNGQGLRRYENCICLPLRSEQTQTKMRWKKFSNIRTYNYWLKRPLQFHSSTFICTQDSR